MQPLWPLYDLWSQHLLPMTDFSKVSIDAVDLGLRALDALEVARRKALK